MVPDRIMGEEVVRIFYGLLLRGEGVAGLRIAYGHSDRTIGRGSITDFLRIFSAKMKESRKKSVSCPGTNPEEI